MQAEVVPQRILDAYCSMHDVDAVLPTLTRPSPFAGPQWYFERISEELDAFDGILRDYPGQGAFVKSLSVEVDKDEFDFGLLEQLSDATDQAVYRLLQYRSTNEYNVFHAIVYRGYDHLISLFVNLGGNVNTATHDGWTPLHEAALFGHIPCAHELLKYGASINATASTKFTDLTALSICIWASQPEMFQFLLSQDADPWKLDNSQHRHTIAHLAAQFDSAALRILLERDRRFAVSRNTRLQTPLHMAAIMGNPDAIKHLIHFGADINARDMDMATPLHGAWGGLHLWSYVEDALAKKLRSRELLIEFGADQNAKAKNGVTPSQAGFGAALIRYSTASYFYKSPLTRFGSGLYSWENARTSCPPAWHVQRCVCIILHLLTPRVYDRSTWRMERMVFLRPSISCQPISIQRSFRNVSTTDERWGYYIVARMGRLDCPYSEFSIKLTVTRYKNVLILNSS